MVRVPITSEKHKRLLALRKKTGVGPTLLLKHEAAKRPPSLTVGMVESWLNGTVKSAEEGHLDFVNDCWSGILEDKNHDLNRSPITQQQLKNLLALRRKTHVGSQALLEHYSAECPPGLTVGMVNSWLNGIVSTAKQEHMEFVAECWNSVLNDDAHPLRTTLLTKAIREELRELRDTSGITPATLLRGQRGEAPKSLESAHIRRWISAERDLHVPTTHLNFVLNRWRKHADPQVAIASGRVQLTDEQVNGLREHAERSRLNPGPLFRGRHAEIPSGLTSEIVRKWINGATRGAIREHYDYVLQLWRDAPTRIEWTHERKQAFIAAFKRAGSPRYAAILARIPSRPDTLTLKSLTRLMGSNAPKYVIERDYELLMNTLQAISET